MKYPNSRLGAFLDISEFFKDSLQDMLGPARVFQMDFPITGLLVLS